MHHTALYTSCITLLLVSHTCTFALDPVKQGPEEPQEPVQAEETNLEQEQDKPRCI
jgi:hypothetical protein